MKSYYYALSKEEQRIMDEEAWVAAGRPERKTVESEFQAIKKILTYCQENGILAWRHDSSGRLFRGFLTKQPKYYRKGVADILGLRDGTFFAIEVKASTPSSLSKEQKEFKSAVRTEGGKFRVVKTAEEGINFLEDDSW